MILLLAALDQTYICNHLSALVSFCIVVFVFIFILFRATTLSSHLYPASRGVSRASNILEESPFVMLIYYFSEPLVSWARKICDD